MARTQVRLPVRQILLKFGASLSAIVARQHGAFSFKTASPTEHHGQIVSLALPWIDLRARDWRCGALKLTFRVQI
jgi:hypothetical protein